VTARKHLDLATRVGNGGYKGRAISRTHPPYSREPRNAGMVNRGQCDRLQNAFLPFGISSRFIDALTQRLRNNAIILRIPVPRLPLVPLSYTKTPRASGLLPAAFKGREQSLHKPVLRDLPRPVPGPKDQSAHPAALL